MLFRTRRIGHLGGITPHYNNKFIWSHSRLTNGNSHLHEYCNFTEFELETVEVSLKPFMQDHI